MRGKRIAKRLHRIGIVSAVAIALLGLFNLFNRHPDAARNAVELFAIAVGVYFVAVAIGWLASNIVRDDAGKASN